MGRRQAQGVGRELGYATSVHQRPRRDAIITHCKRTNTQSRVEKCRLKEKTDHLKKQNKNRKSFQRWGKNIS